MTVLRTVILSKNVIFSQTSPNSCGDFYLTTVSWPCMFVITNLKMEWERLFSQLHEANPDSDLINQRVFYMLWSETMLHCFIVSHIASMYALLTLQTDCFWDK